MSKLTAIRIIATIGMVLFFVSGIANIFIASAHNYPMLAGVILWAIFGIWASKTSKGNA